MGEAYLLSPPPLLSRWEFRPDHSLLEPSWNISRCQAPLSRHHCRQPPSSSWCLSTTDVSRPGAAPGIHLAFTTAAGAVLQHCQAPTQLPVTTSEARQVFCLRMHSQRFLLLLLFVLHWEKFKHFRFFCKPGNPPSLQKNMFGVVWPQSVDLGIHRQHYTSLLVYR